MASKPLNNLQSTLAQPLQAQRQNKIQQAEDTNISEHQQTRLSPIHLSSLDHVNMQYSNFKSDTTCATSHLHTHHSPVLRNRQKLWSPGQDSNLRIDGFAIHAIESLWYRDISLYVNTLKRDLSFPVTVLSVGIMCLHISWRTENTS